ncbi:hypothetical protein QBC42DRAFT_344320 [Cladorrhinum samala]|uniref:3-carboxymuconate cyclase n=1 Tax=Cladorrhinum samala TaxID=585594 RepID=A0AAV9HVX1_9PEZI|nr:hypothetical protein QBC42DRAFT_344320 [Cladorrhinum samala]
MKFSISSSIFLVAASASAAAVRRQSCGGTPMSSSKALYFLDNNPAGSSIVALKIAEDGTLSDPVRTSTGGSGSIGLTADGPAQIDSLFSQDSVVVSGNNLFTINAGSNTLSHFLISPSNPQNLTLAGDPVPTGGTFPNSVAFSPKLNMVCVLHTGAPSPGVMCFRLDPATNALTPQGCGIVPLPSISSAQTQSPPTGPANTASDILFNPDATALFATVKGNGADSPSGSVFTFPVNPEDGSLGPAVESKPEGLQLEFSMTFLNSSSAVITDPSFGAALVGIEMTTEAGGAVAAGPGPEVKLARRTEIENQTAICWSVYSNSRQEIYISDTGSPDITVLDAGDGSVKRVIAGPEGAVGSLDSVLLGGKLYVLQAASGISVLDVDAAGLGENGEGAAGQVVQSLDLSGLGERSGWMGMAAYRGEEEE